MDDAELRLDEFAAKWDGAYPTISQMWRRNWEHLTPFFAYPADIRKVIYTTNAVESLNMSLRKVIKTRGSFPNEEAAMKLLYLALEHIAKKWTMPVQNWKAALQRFAILLGDRVPQAELAKLSLQEQSEEEHFWDRGSAPKPPRFIAFAPGFLDRKASCARAPGIPAPSRRSGCVSAEPYPSAQVRSVYQGCKIRKRPAVYTKNLTRPIANSC